jgi:CheY-like chemotaxis protein
MVRVLIVEDESQVLVLAQSILEQAGHDLISAATVAEAQSIITSDEKFDLQRTTAHGWNAIAVRRAERIPAKALYR